MTTADLGAPAAGARPLRGRAWDPAAPGSPLAALDQVAERAFGAVRGRRAPDTAAALLSDLSDYGAVWVVLAGVMARRPGPRRRRAVAALAASGVASFLLNRALKRAVGRERPVAPPPPLPFPVRTPSSASFPSGHTLAAFSTALVLPESAAGSAAALGFAASVAASRVHLGAHHASDVVAGAAVGTVLGLVLRRGLGRLLPDRRPAAR